MGFWDDIAGAVGETVGGLFGGGSSEEDIVPSGFRSSGPPLTGYANLANPTATSLPAGQAQAAAQGQQQQGDTVALIMQRTGYSRPQAIDLLESANSSGATPNTAFKLLAAIGIEPFASYLSAGGGGGGGGSSGGGGGGGSAGALWTPIDDANLQRILLGNRQVGALFDSNYPDGAWIPMPDGTMRLNGTEILIDPREKGQFKQVENAPGYLVDPLTGSVIDTNGNQIRREELQEAIRSNVAQETLSGRRLDLDTELGRFDSDLAAELGRGRLDLDRVIEPGRLNLQAATSENEQALKNILETNALNLESFLGTGNLNIGATNAETNRLNALTTRTGTAGNLARDLQQLQDARTFGVIDLMANPNDFVEREYATRALLTPPGYTGPAFRDDPRIDQIINELMQTPDVSGLIETFVAPNFAPVNLPNPSLPRVSAPPAQPQAVRTPVNTPPPRQTTDITGAAYTNTNVTPANQAASTHFRNVGVPDWALAPLGYAYGAEDIPMYAQGTQKDKTKKRIAPNPDILEGIGELIGAPYQNRPLTYILYGLSKMLEENNEIIPSPWDRAGTGKPIPNWNPNDWPDPGMHDLPVSPWTEQEKMRAWGTDKFATGTPGTHANQFVVGDPQLDGGPNPEMVNINNPGPRTTASVTPLRNMLSGIGNRFSQSNQQGLNNQIGIPQGETPSNIGIPGNTNFPTNLPNLQQLAQQRANYNVPSSFPTATSPKFTTQLPQELTSFFGGEQPLNMQNFLQTAAGNSPYLQGVLDRFPYQDLLNGNPQQAPQAPQIPQQPTEFNYDELRNAIQQWMQNRFNRTNTPAFAYGTNSVFPSGAFQQGITPNTSGGSSGAIPGNPNLDTQGNYTGARGSSGQPLGNLTSYPDQAIRNLPSVQRLSGQISPEQYNTLSTQPVTGAFGVQLPDVGGLNYGQLLNLQQDPDSFGLINSLYNSANRNLQGIINRVLARAPIGNASTSRSTIRTV